MTRQLLAIALLVIASCNQLFGHKIDAMEFEFQATKEAWVLKGAIDVSYLLPEFRNDDDEPPLRRYPLMNETSPDQWKVYLSEMEATLNRLLTFKFNGQTIPHTFHYPGFSIEKPVLPEDLDDIAFIHIEIKAAPVAGEGELRIHWNDDLEAELIVVVDDQAQHSVPVECGAACTIDKKSRARTRTGTTGTMEVAVDMRCFDPFEVGMGISYLL